MDSSDELQDICPAAPAGSFGGDHVSFGVPIPKQKRLEILDPSEWESFIEEWALSLKDEYHDVKRHAGAGDKGLDVVGLIASEQLADGYDNYQCKYYDHPLTPSDVWIEFGKLIFYTLRGDYPVPRRYKFAAPKGIGTKLHKLLGNAVALKQELEDNWERYCRSEITSGQDIPLRGELLEYFSNFDFSIFGSISGARLIEEHANTPFHAVRFGGGLPERPPVEVPPEVQPEETRFTEQLLDAYSDNAKTDVTKDSLAGSEYELDYKMQRERFYSAESLRNFARDNVPPGTFETVQDEAFEAVYDVSTSVYPCGFSRMKAVLNQVTSATFGFSPLFSRILEKDKKGLCHQLANEDRLRWVP